MEFAARTRPMGGLPAEVTGFIGREAELAHLARLLDTSRLVTVTGAGGVGKTRIALRTAARIAERFEDGICLVELSSLRDPELVPHTLAGHLGLPEQDTRSPLDAVLDYLANRRVLLVLDTCEHLVDACAMLVDLLLRKAPGITVLATSRQPLDAPGEHTVPVPPLPVPDPDALPAVLSPGAPAGDSAPPPASSGDAVELFAQRAAAALPGFAVTPDNRADIIRLCRRLDGIPLAIELAAVRLRAVPLSQLVDRLEDRFRLLTGGRRTSLPRHQTLRTAIDWSHGLCTEAERLLWARLSVFAGTFDIAAAEEVTHGGDLEPDEVLETLIGLVDKSLVLRIDGPGDTRYRLLDTLREYGAEQLAESGEEALVREQHLARYLRLADDFDRGFLSDQQVVRYLGLHVEHANLRLALENALGLPDLDRKAAALATALWGYWHIAGLHTEGRYWYRRILERFPEPGSERGWALAESAYLGAFQADPTALDEAQECVEIADALQEDVLGGRGRVYLNLSLTFQGRHDEAEKAAQEAHEQLERVGDLVGLATLETQIGYLHHLMGRLDSSLDWCRRGLARFSDGSREAWVRGYLYYVSGAARFRRGEYPQSAAAGAVALRLKHSLGDGLGTAYCLELLAWLSAHDGRFERAAHLLGAADPLWRRAGARLGGTVIMEDLHQDAERAAETALGEAVYAVLFERGAARPLDEMVAMALCDADRPDGARVAAETHPAAEARSAESSRPLTNRESEVADLVLQGMSNREIAERLVVSKRTVDAHVEHILAKLDIGSRTGIGEALVTGTDGNAQGPSGHGGTPGSQRR